MPDLDRSNLRPGTPEVRPGVAGGEAVSLPPLPGGVPAERSFDPARWCIQYEKLVDNVVRRRIRNPHVAEDVAQMAWLRILRVGPTYDPARSKEATFVYLVARTAVTDFLRSEMRRWQMLPTAPVSDDADVSAPETLVAGREPSPSHGSERNEELAAILDRIARLSPRVREMIEGVYGRGWTAREVARDLGIPLGTVKSTIFRTMERLRQRHG